MKDRQPTKVLANGAIRYGIYREDGTLDHYEYMKREDAPTVEGTPLNKANLLSDATAAKLWPNAEARPDDPTVNDAFGKLAQGTARVGDIEISTRTDLSDAWLPCDGRTISQEQYPELFSVLRSSAAPLPWTLKTVSINPTAMWFLNGEWVAMSGNKLYTSTDLETWTQRTSIPSGLSMVDAVLEYAGGFYYTILDSGSTATTGIYKTSSLDTEFTLYANGSLPSTRTNGNRGLFITPNFLYIYAVGTEYGSYGGHEYDYIRCSYVNPATQTIVSIGTIDGVFFYNQEQERFYKLELSKTNNSLTTATAETLINPTWETVSTVSLASLSPSFNEPSSYTTHDLMSAYHCGTAIIAFFGITKTEIYSSSGNYFTRYTGYMVYRYSIDDGATWNNGRIVSYESGGNWLPTYTLGEYKSGLLLVPGNVATAENSTSEDKIIAIREPAAGQAYSDVLGNRFPSIVLSQDGKAAYAADGGIAYCDYSAGGKAVPIIGLSTVGQAYIKALEE